MSKILVYLLCKYAILPVTNDNHSTTRLASTYLLEVSITVYERYHTKSNVILSYIPNWQFHNIPDIRVKLSAGTTTLRFMAVERKIHALLNTALHLCEWSPSSSCHFTSSTHSTKGSAGLRTGVTTVAKRRITARLWVQLSLQWLCYPNYTQ